MLKCICHNLYIFERANRVALWHMNLVVFVLVCGPLRNWSTENWSLTAKHLLELQICRMSCLRHGDPMQNKCCEQPCGQAAVQDREPLTYQDDKRHTFVHPSIGCGVLWTWWLQDWVPLMVLNLERCHWFSLSHTTIMSPFRSPMWEDSWTSRILTLACGEPEPPL